MKIIKISLLLVLVLFTGRNTFCGPTGVYLSVGTILGAIGGGFVLSLITKPVEARLSNDERETLELTKGSIVLGGPLWPVKRIIATGFGIPIGGFCGLIGGTIASLF